MRKLTLIQGLTLLSFVFFITTFLLYRVGKLDPYLSNEKLALQTSPNGGTITIAINDSPKLKKDSTHKLMLSSSKVLILTDKRYSFLDSIKKKPKPVYWKPKSREMMSSSKSSIIFFPVPYSKLKTDSLKKDSTKMKRKQ